MGKTTKRAILLNKNGGGSKFIKKEDFKDFIEEFLTISKKKMTSPPTEFEKAMIMATPLEETKKRTSKKVIIPEIINDRVYISLKKKKKRPKKTVIPEVISGPVRVPFKNNKKIEKK